MGVHLKRIVGRDAVWRGCAGQAFLESFIVILIVCVLLFGFLQMAVVVTGDEMLHHAAARAARARSVGFNGWMATKAMRVASIPNAGRMIMPPPEEVVPVVPFGANLSAGRAMDVALSAVSSVSPRAAFERVRIPAYLEAENSWRAAYVMGYEEWARGSFSHEERSSIFGGGLLWMKVRQDFPLRMPFNRFLFPFARRDENGDGRISLSGESEAGEHASLYLEP